MVCTNYEVAKKKDADRPIFNMLKAWLPIQKTQKVIIRLRLKLSKLVAY